MFFIQNINHEFTTIEVIVMVLYGAFILLLTLFGSDLLARYIRADKRTRGDAAYMIFFIISCAMLGYGLYLFPAFINYFLQKDFEAQDLNLKWIPAFQYVIMLSIIVSIGYVCLLILLKNKKVILYSISLFGILTVLYMFIWMVLCAIDPENIRYVVISSPTMIPVILVIFGFGIIDFLGIVYILVVKLSPQREVRRRVLFGIFGIIIAGVGGFIEISIRKMSNYDQQWWYVYGTLIELFGFLIMRYFFLSIPSYDEFSWKSGMKELHVIIAETGISLFYQSFAEIVASELHGDIKVTATIPEDENRPNTDLVAGGLVGIKGMLSEISGDRGKLENIEIGEKSLIFKQGKVVLCLLLADENLGVYHSILEELVEKIELSHPDLANFNGDTRKLHIQPIVEEVFDIKPKKKKQIKNNQVSEEQKV
ncbi:MAG: hypothetical protein K9W44_18220 [Candidatus Lokiarchaeota archaeon]|nr:hypothetical protein [Candidatus Harpocratesius repetitus]